MILSKLLLLSSSFEFRIKPCPIKIDALVTSGRCPAAGRAAGSKVDFLSVVVTCVASRPKIGEVKLSPTVL